MRGRLLRTILVIGVQAPLIAKLVSLRLAEMLDPVAYILSFFSSEDVCTAFALLSFVFP